MSATDPNVFAMAIKRTLYPDDVSSVDAVEGGRRWRPCALLLYVLFRLGLYQLLTTNCPQMVHYAALKINSAGIHCALCRMN